MKWLIFFSSLPSKPVGNRVKVWRRLTKSGAVQLAGSVYVLPAGEDHGEFFQWLAAEIAGMGGEAAFARVDRVETVPDEKIVTLFEKRKANDYRPIGAFLDVFERKLESARQGGRAASRRSLALQKDKLRKAFEEARRTDFFASPAGGELGERLALAEAALASLGGSADGPAPPAIARRVVEDFRGRRWATRSRPFIDRMASAWLIRRFIDPAAVFTFVDEADAGSGPIDAVAFDLAGGEFSHVGDLCTFEVLVRSFGLTDPHLAGLAEIVHDLDVEDGRYRRPEAPGLRAVLDGVRRTARDDADALERGMMVFELLFAARTSPGAAMETGRTRAKGTGAG
jgi:hypothetical protein